METIFFGQVFQQVWGCLNRTMQYGNSEKPFYYYYYIIMFKSYYVVWKHDRWADDWETLGKV